MKPKSFIHSYVLLLKHHLLAIPTVGFTLQLVVNNTQWITIAVIATALYIKVERKRFTSITIFTFNVLWADTFS